MKIEIEHIKVADAGYCSEENLGKETPEELIIATQKDWKERKEASPPRGRTPKGMSLRDFMKRKLHTKRGKELHRKRGQIVEPVFGQLKKLSRYVVYSSNEAESPIDYRSYSIQLYQT